MIELPHYQTMTQLRNDYLKTQNEDIKQKFLDAVQAFKKSQEEFALKEYENGEPEVKYAFIVFRDMDAMEIVKRAYEVGTFEKWVKMGCLGSCCCSSEHRRLKKLHFFKKWPKIEDACEPDNIKWMNLGASAKYRRSLSCIVWCIAIFLIACSLIGIVIFKNKTDELEKEFTSNVICPVDSIDMKIEAYNDFILPIDERIGLMGCYCKAYGI
jgi:hypothetical protein